MGPYFADFDSPQIWAFYGVLQKGPLYGRLCGPRFQLGDPKTPCSGPRLYMQTGLNMLGTSEFIQLDLLVTVGLASAHVG